MKQMVKLKVLVVTNYGFSIPELANFSVIGSLPSLKRIMLERVSIPAICNTMEVLKNLENMTLVMCKINKAFFYSTIKIPEMLPNLRGGLNSLPDSSNNNFVVLETKLSSIDMRISRGEDMNCVSEGDGDGENVETKKSGDDGKKDSDSGYFINGAQVESDVSVVV